MVVKRLEAVRETRNDVMHFRPDGLEPERLEVLQGLGGLLPPPRPNGRRRDVDQLELNRGKADKRDQE